MRQFISFLFGKSFILLGEKSILLWENFTLIRDFFLIKKHFCFLKRELLSDISKLISYQHEIDCETTEHKKLQQIQHWLSLAQLSSACFLFFSFVFKFCFFGGGIFSSAQYLRRFWNCITSPFLDNVQSFTLFVLMVNNSGHRLYRKIFSKFMPFDFELH